MVKTIFTTKVDPTYDDLPTFRYHFPRTYLRQAEAAVGDWIIYYEPRRSSGDASSRGGRQAYFATAKVTQIKPDPNISDHFYAFVEEYIDFDRAVPFREGERYYELGLLRDDGGTNKGAFGRAIRNISDEEYDGILRAGFQPILEPRRPDFMATFPLEFAEEQETFERPIVERLVRRPFRDVAFSAAVKTAYDDTCAVTGLRLLNGGGRAEVQAAHIRPVAERGPDSIRNGLALSSTVHWMFDRGLLSATDDFRLLIGRGGVPEPLKMLFSPSGSLLLPRRPEWRPHPGFLRYHREHIFKG